MNSFNEPTEKTGYLEQDFRLFHIKDQTKREFSYHYHDFHKVIIFLSGKAAYHIEGKSYYLKPWDILLVNRHAIHKPEIDFSVPYERFVLWIRDDIKSTELLRCFQKAIDRSYNLIRLDSDTQEKLKQLLYELEAALKDEKFGSDLLGSALFAQFMVYVNRIFLEKQYIYDTRSYSSDSQIEELLRYINHNLTEDLSIETLARKYYLSKYHMMRKFKEETGYTIHNYIISKRLLLARTKISEGTPILKAAQLSGFSDYTTFSRAYKKQFGTAPSQTI
ncbi:AraC family transcriptional regulator [Blautia faecis]|mgnify:FL=1|uniref:helix-turn-helix domain-containing protein n=1 Tax=Blautia faecis TaxID=871665 RepID=UPI001D0243C8|nr:AraC family transcriptional regulator [Blautia faecis]MCB5481100.1 AraC family transcriptional regulator [Blautia faecis]